jgi:phage/plasmid-associated DNA primase
MPVPLAISHKGEHHWDQTPEWQDFMDKVGAICEQQYPSGVTEDGQEAFAVVRDQILEAYHAWTNWSDWNDPLWFPDEDHRAAFVITWLC